MKRILILSDAFLPPLYLPRVRNLAVNLQNNGWTVAVATEQASDMPSHTYPFTLFQMPFYSKNNLHNKILWFGDKLFNLKESRFYKFLTQTIKPTDFDFILCSTFSTFPLLAAERLANDYNIPLYVDLRDIAEQWGDTPYFANSLPKIFNIDKLLAKIYNRMSIRRRNRVLHKAVAVSTVSPWHVDLLKAINPNTVLIYNGFDEQIYKPEIVRADKFIISYCGRIYEFKLRNPQLLFKALSNLVLNGSIEAGKVQLIFHVEDDIIGSLRQYASEYGLQDITIVEPYISTTETLELMYRSSICLLLTNRQSANGPHGIMTTKFFEILGIEKPLLCVRSDEAVLADVINQTNAGLAASETSEVEEYIKEKYDEWQDKGYTSQPINKEMKQLFTRQYQAHQFEELFDGDLED